MLQQTAKSFAAAVPALSSSTTHIDGPPQNRSKDERASKHIPELDGIRGIAILLVTIVHGGGSVFNWLHLGWFAERAWVGVDLFFVLSGFLITGILLESRTKRSYFADFYVRRCLRIWPLYYLFLTGAIVLAAIAVRYMPAVAHIRFDASHAAPIWVLLCFLQNYTAQITLSPVLSVTWSLAVEEQFYMLWPIVVRFVSRSALVGLSLTVLFADPILRYWAPAMSTSPAMVYICTPFRLDGLAAGSLLAILYRSECFNRFGFRMANWTALAIGTVGSVILLRPATEAGQNPLAFSASAVMFGGLLGITLTKAGDASLWAKLLKSPPLTQMGRLSYCIYLIHLPIFVFFESNPLRRHLHLRAGIGTEVITLVAAFLLTILIASISWAAFESKFIGLRERMSGLISNVRPRRVDAHA